MSRDGGVGCECGAPHAVRKSQGEVGTLGTRASGKKGAWKRERILGWRGRGFKGGGELEITGGLCGRGAGSEGGWESVAVENASGRGRGEM